MFKVIVIGDSRVGKSAFIDRYVHRRFRDRIEYKCTVGGKFFQIFFVSLTSIECAKHRLLKAKGIHIIV